MDEQSDSTTSSSTISPEQGIILKGDDMILNVGGQFGFSCSYYVENGESGYKESYLPNVSFDGLRIEVTDTEVLPHGQRGVQQG